MKSAGRMVIADLISVEDLLTNPGLMDVHTTIMNLVVMQMSQEPVSDIVIRIRRL
jgi:hypothetical protein